MHVRPSWWVQNLSKYDARAWNSHPKCIRKKSTTGSRDGSKDNAKSMKNDENLELNVSRRFRSLGLRIENSSTKNWFEVRKFLSKIMRNGKSDAEIWYSVCFKNLIHALCRRRKSYLKWSKNHKKWTKKWIRTCGENFTHTVYTNSIDDKKRVKTFWKIDEKRRKLGPHCEW